MDHEHDREHGEDLHCKLEGDASVDRELRLKDVMYSFPDSRDVRGQKSEQHESRDLGNVLLLSFLSDDRPPSFLQAGNDLVEGGIEHHPSQRDERRDPEDGDDPVGRILHLEVDVLPPEPARDHERQGGQAARDGVRHPVSQDFFQGLSPCALSSPERFPADDYPTFPWKNQWSRL